MNKCKFLVVLALSTCLGEVVLGAATRVATDGKVRVQPSDNPASLQATPGTSVAVFASNEGLMRDRLSGRILAPPAPEVPPSVIPPNFPSYVVDSYAQRRYRAFNPLEGVNDLTGSLEGMVVLGQSQLIPARQRVAGDKQPRLSALRKTLVLFKFKGQEPAHSAKVTVKAMAGNGQLLGEQRLLPPILMPMQAGFFAGFDPALVTFAPLRSGALQVEAGSLPEAQTASALGRHLAQSSVRQVVVNFEDGNYTPSVTLPQTGVQTGDQILFKSSATYSTNILYTLPNGTPQQLTLSAGTTLLLRYDQKGWLHASDLDRSKFIYDYGHWSAVLPKEWIAPGLKLTFSHAQKTGTLSPIAVGPATELRLNVVDIGMLTPPRGEFSFAKDERLQKEYFQRIPVSKLLVNPYQPVHWTEIVLPSGVRLTGKAPDVGDVYSGSMREAIGKRLISAGIVNANLGIHVTEPELQLITTEMSVHNSVGRYANGRVVHGLSGGSGVVTLWDSVGNELSHEIGHAFGLGHYVGGSRDSVHQPGGRVNSTWGWDSLGNRLLPNFSRDMEASTSCWQDSLTDCVPAFNMDGRTYAYGYDAMSGGMSPDKSTNRYTMHPPSIMQMIQQFLESKAVHDPASATGFSVWHEASQSMVPYTHKVNMAMAGAVNLTLAEMGEPNAIQQKLQAKSTQAVEVAVYDGFWAPTVRMPGANLQNQNKYVRISADATYATTLNINDSSFEVPRGKPLLYVSNGSQWVTANAMPDPLQPQKPQAFGVPVTTVVGYYDPMGLISPGGNGFGYIYPALHGAYGHVYPSDSLQDVNDCHLRVATSAGEKYFKLKNFRVEANVMNSFHVNVATSLQPSAARVDCNNTLLAQRRLEPPTQALKMTVHTP